MVKGGGENQRVTPNRWTGQDFVIDEEKENLERTKPGTYRFITNFLGGGSIKNKKIENLLYTCNKNIV